MYDKQVVYDPETRDFACYLDGELVGFARTRQEGEQTLDALVYKILTEQSAKDNGEYAAERVASR